MGYSDGRFPETWDEYRAVGKKLKAQGRPYGESLGHTFGDPIAFFLVSLFSGHGAAGRSRRTARRSRSTARRQWVGQVHRRLWNDSYDPGGLAWDDQATTEPSSPALSARPITAPQSILRPKRSRKHI